MPLAGIRREFADGEIVFSRGDAAADMYLVSEGSVELIAWGPEGPLTLEVVKPGEVFGEMALFSPGPRSASAVARGATVLECIDKPTFQACVNDPVIWAICKRMSERLRKATAELLDDE